MGHAWGIRADANLNLNIELGFYACIGSHTDDNHEFHLSPVVALAPAAPTSANVSTISKQVSDPSTEDSLQIGVMSRLGKGPVHATYASYAHVCPMGRHSSGL